MLSVVACCSMAAVAKFVLDCYCCLMAVHC